MNKLKLQYWKSGDLPVGFIILNYYSDSAYIYMGCATSKYRYKKRYGKQ